MAPAGDAFFSKGNKRKRTQSSRNDPRKNARKSQSSAYSKKPTKAASRRDEELDSQHTDSDDNIGGNIDDIDLRQSDVDENASGEEDENETAAQKRLRLAKLYLQSVKQDLGAFSLYLLPNYLFC